MAKDNTNAEALRMAQEKAAERTQAMVNYADSLDNSSKRLQRGTDRRTRSGSIINAAKGNVFEFPVFVSSSTPLEYATATNSLLEQVYASYLQMAVSINPVVDAETARNGGVFSQFKSNTNKYLEHTDMSYAHDACHAVYESDECIIEFNMIDITDQESQVIIEQCDYQPLSEFSHYFQEAKDYPAKKTKKNKDNNDSNDDTKKDNKNKPTFDDDDDDVKDTRSDNKQSGKDRWDHQKSRKDKDQTEKDKQKKLLDELRDKETHQMSKEKHAADMEKHQMSKDKHDADMEKHASDMRNSATNIKKNIKDAELTQKKIDSYDDEQKRAKEKHAVDTKIKAAQFIDESKIQKLNTMKPLMMSVNLGIMDKDGGVSRPMEYVVGVKTHCRIVPSDILPEVAEYPIKEMDKLARKAKWRAGELKFFKDIVFKIKQKKQSAIDSKDPKRKWYRRLYDLAHMTGDAPSASIVENKSFVKALLNKLAGKQGASYGIIPNATMIITKSDIDNIKSETKIDLLKGSTAVKFCKELFLISLVVIDTDQESIKIILPDLHNDYEVHSLASVNKQLAMLDTAGSKTRDILKVLG